MTSETQSQTTNNSTELLDGVKILVERMETHPEDFIYQEEGIGARMPRFWHITDALGNVIYGKEDTPGALIHLTSEEKTALIVAYRKMMRQHFTSSVISKLYAAQEEVETPNVTIKTRGRYPAGTWGAVAKQEGAQVNYYDSENGPIIRVGNQ